MKQRTTVVDLFCGAGGLSKGFEHAGFDVVFGNDIDATFGDTYRQSHRHAAFVTKPIQSLDVAEISATAGLDHFGLDVLVGGPPCQGYSVYNHGRGEHDPRAGLFREYLRLVQGLRPNWIVMENVTGLLSISGGGLIRLIIEEIRALGYANVDYAVLRAEEFGVPQERRRVVFIANRVGLPIVFPKATHGTGLRPVTTVWDAIGDLPPVFEPPEDVHRPLPYGSPPVHWFQQSMRKNSLAVHNHYGPRLGKANQERIKHIPQGGSWRDIPFDLLPEGMKRAKRSDHTKRYGRPRLTDLSCTVLTKCDIHWGAYIHPIQNRAFTVREAARLQSFPDDFLFHGSMTEQFVQVGNAVPPLMAQAVAEQVKLLQRSVMPMAA